ncbi:phosphoribosylanthranilate isomerase [Hyphomicrobium sp. 2TAF46]|uniref:phosphoribosylanthranilate isomerase n=1 Tax=Hyphomicrobium sp. 2TAF46 TaxID=3233019 RepID=UPI003F93E8CB
MVTRAKICGITTPEALDAAITGGADYIGLVFYAKSPRHLDIAKAKGLAERARGKARIVALTVDADDATLNEIVNEVAPDVLQLHGKETPSRVAAIKEQFGREVIKAIAVATADDVAQAREYADVADLILFDAKAPPGALLPGGNGRTFDWHALDGVAEALPFMLSGGLGPDNVADAIALTHPLAVDVSSGVESAPGIKDPDQIRRFLLAVKAAKQA